MKLKQITFHFENLESITIDGKYVGYFLVDELSTYFARTACNSFDKMDVANVFAIEIHKDANKEYYAFGQMDCEDCKCMTFDRVTGYNDITSIQFEMVRECSEYTSVAEKYDYLVHWAGDSDFINEAQINYISQDGHLYIVIAEGKTIEDFFDKEDIDDSEYMDFHFDMFDVGDEHSNTDRYKEETQMDNKGRMEFYFELQQTIMNQYQVDESIAKEAIMKSDMNNIIDAIGKFVYHDPIDHWAKSVWCCYERK